MLADLADGAAVNAMVQGVDAIVHLGGYSESQTLAADMPPRPDGFYGVSKAFGEDLSRFYFDRYSIETACLTTPVLGHSIIFGMSNNAVTWWNNEQARHVG